MKQFHLLSLKKPELDFSAFFVLVMDWFDFWSTTNWTQCFLMQLIRTYNTESFASNSVLVLAQIPNVEVTLLWINIYVKISCFGESHSVMLMQGRKPPFEAVNKNLLKSSLHLHIIAAEINLGETMALSCSRYCT